MTTELRNQLASDIRQLETGLRQAHEAGDTERATRYAQAFRAANRRLTNIINDPTELDPTSQQFRDKYGAAAVSTPENFAAGAGKFLTDRVRGVGQITGLVDQESIDEAGRLDRDLEQSGAGTAGQILGGTAFTAPLALVPGANTGLGASLIGGGIGLTEPTESDESRALNTAFGAAGGFAGQRLGRFLQGSRGGPNLNQTERQILTRGEQLGFRATPGQATGSRPLQQAEAALESKAFTSGPIADIQDANQLTLNQIAARSVGQQADEMSPSVIDDAFDELGTVFENTARAIPDAQIDGLAYGRFLQQLQQQFSGVADSDVLSNKLVEELTRHAARGSARGDQLRSLSSRLGTRIQNLMTTPSGDRGTGMALIQVKDFLDNIIQTNLPAAQRQAFATAREQYRNLLFMMSRQNVIGADGNVRGPALFSALSRDRTGMRRGRNTSDLYDAARFAATFRSIVGNSGTATRDQGATDLLVGLPFNLASRVYFGRPATAVAQGAGRGLDAIRSTLGPYADPALLGLLGANVATAE